MHIVKLIFFVLTFTYTYVSYGQVKQEKYKAGYLVSIGTATYVGDLTDEVQALTFQPAIGIGVHLFLNQKFSLRSEANYFRLSGKKYVTSKNYLGFTSNNSEISAILMYDIISRKKQFIARPNNSFYVFGGLGLATFQATIDKSGDVPEFRSIDQNPFSGITAILPFGVGLKCKTSKTIDIALEIGFRKSFTDYLDNITPYHNNPDNPLTYSTSIPKTNENSGKKDSYFFSTVKIIYTPKYIFKKKPNSLNSSQSAASKRSKKTSQNISRSSKLNTHKQSTEK